MRTQGRTLCATYPRRWLPVALLFIFVSLPLRGFADAKSDEQGQALLGKFKGMKVVGSQKENFAATPKDRMVGSVTLGPGKNFATDANDKAAVFPKDAEAKTYVYVAAWLASKEHLSLDFCLDEAPGVNTGQYCLFSVGTGGNGKLWIKINIKGEVTATVLTAKASRTLTSAPAAWKAWHHLDFYYAPDGAVLLIDDKVQDFSNENFETYYTGGGDAAYIGNMPDYDPAAKQAVFYKFSPIGSIDNFLFEQLE